MPTEFTCPECGKNLFRKVIKLLKVSKLEKENTSGQDLIIPNEFFQCRNKKCHHVIKDIVPIPIQKGSTQQ